MVRVVKFQTAAFDQFTDAPNTDLQAWIDDHYYRLSGSSPYMDPRLSWAPPSWFYKDLYDGNSVAAAHPDWILKDSGGHNLYINFACNGMTCSQLAGDTGLPAFRSNWISAATTIFGRAAWVGTTIDDCNMDLSRVSNGAGTPTVPIDPRTGVGMTNSNWQKYMAEFLEAIAAANPSKTQTQNPLWFFPNTAFITRQIQAAGVIAMERGFNDGGIVAGNGQFGYNTLLTYLDFVHAQGKPMWYDAFPTTDIDREYGLANYFLMDNGGDMVGFTPGTEPNNWWPGVDVNLGAASGPRVADGGGLFHRNYTDGRIYVNSPGAASASPALGGTFTTLDGTSITSLTLAGTRGKVLQTAKPSVARMGEVNDDFVASVATGPLGEMYVGGNFHGTMDLGGGVILTSAGGYDWWIAKYSPTGTIIWGKSEGGPTDDFLEQVAVDQETGDVVAVGEFTGSAVFGGSTLVSAGLTDMAIIRLGNAAGAAQWTQRFGGVNDDDIQTVTILPKGSIALSGFFRASVNFGGSTLTVPFTSDLDVFLAVFTSGGTHVVSQHWNNTGNERGYGITADYTGNLTITGSFSNSINFQQPATSGTGGAPSGPGVLTAVGGFTDIFIASFTPTGAHRWSKRLGSNGDNESGYGVAADPATGDVLWTGYAIAAIDLGGGNLAPLGNVDGLVARYLGTTGAFVWGRRFGGTGSDSSLGVSARGAAVAVTGNFDAQASFGSVTLTPNGRDGFLAAYNILTGAPIRARQFGGAGQDGGNDVAVAPNGDQIVGGVFTGTGQFNGSGGGSLTSAGVTDGWVSRVAP